MYNFLRALLVIEITMVAPTFVSAADWKQLSHNDPSAFIDTGSIREVGFPKFTGVYTSGTPTQNYKVVWLQFTTPEENIKVEAVFDCQGAFGVMQQIVANNSSTSPFKLTQSPQYRSFDNTQVFRTSGVQTKDIAPDTEYEIAEKLVCK